MSRVPRSSISIKVPLQRLHFPCIMPTALYPSPYAQSNSRLGAIDELNASRFEDLTKAVDGTGVLFARLRDLSSACS